MMTHREFAATDEEFQEACSKADAKLIGHKNSFWKGGIEPTKRQAAKFRNRRGLAFATHLDILVERTRKKHQS